MRVRMRVHVRRGMGWVVIEAGVLYVYVITVCNVDACEKKFILIQEKYV
jgi:hypothetical protein